MSGLPVTPSRGGNTEPVSGSLDFEPLTFPPPLQAGTQNRLLGEIMLCRVMFHRGGDHKPPPGRIIIAPDQRQAGIRRIFAARRKGWDSSGTDPSGCEGLVGFHTEKPLCRGCG